MPKTDAALVRAAVLNNAEWCDTVCRSHGIVGTFGEQFWATSHRPLPLYPDAVTLTPHASSVQVLQHVDFSPGCAIKDSYAALDLTDARFRVLFDAQWICLAGKAGAPADASPIAWSTVQDAAGLSAWTAAWADDNDAGEPFLPHLLDDPRVEFLAGHHGEQIKGGAITFRNDAVVSVCNVFAADGHLDGIWAGVLTHTADRFPDLPVVGYESGEDLAAALRQGCITIGTLRVWLHAP